MKEYIFILLLAVLLLPVPLSAAEKGIALKADNIRSEPYSDAKSFGKIARGEKLEILGKKGAWLNVKTAKSRGWVRLLSVKRGTIGGGKEASSLLYIATGRAGTGKVVATTGVRGLNEEELKNAKYDEAEIKMLESYTQTAEQGRQFAQNGGLKAVKLNYLPEK